MGGKEKFPSSKYGIIFGYPFEGCTRGLDCERRRVVLGPLIPNFGSCSRPTIKRSGIMGEKQSSPLPNIESYLDTHLRVSPVVLILSEDVWFLGHIFPTSGPILSPCLNRVVLWVENKSSPLPNMESYLDTHLRVAPVVLIVSEDVWFLGLFFQTSGLVLGPHLNGVGLLVEKKILSLPSKNIKIYMVSESLFMCQCDQKRPPALVCKRLSTNLLFTIMVVPLHHFLYHHHNHRLIQIPKSPMLSHPCSHHMPVKD
jgi:hypothetical protein